MCAVFLEHVTWRVFGTGYGLNWKKWAFPYKISQNGSSVYKKILKLKAVLSCTQPLAPCKNLSSAAVFGPAATSGQACGKTLCVICGVTSVMHCSVQLVIHHKTKTSTTGTSFLTMPIPDLRGQSHRKLLILRRKTVRWKSGSPQYKSRRQEKGKEKEKRKRAGTQESEQDYFSFSGLSKYWKANFKHSW